MPQDCDTCALARAACNDICSNLNPGEGAPSLLDSRFESLSDVSKLKVSALISTLAVANAGISALLVPPIV